MGLYSRQISDDRGEQGTDSSEREGLIEDEQKGDSLMSVSDFCFMSSEYRISINAECARDHWRGDNLYKLCGASETPSTQQIVY